MAPRSRQTAPPDPQRQLMIKTKTCQRLIKEVDYYRKEVLENETKLQRMIDENRDHYDIKKFREVLGESHMMVPDAGRRLAAAVDDLGDFLRELDNSAEDSAQLAEGGWHEQARAILLAERGGSSGTKDADGGTENDTAATRVDDLAEGEVF